MDPSLIKGRRVGRRSNLGSGEPAFRGGNAMATSQHSHSEHTLSGGGTAAMRYPEHFKENNCGGVMRPLTSVIRSIGNSAMVPQQAVDGVLVPGHGQRMDERAYLKEQLSPTKRQAPRGIAISILNRHAQEYSNGYLYNKNITDNYRAALPTPPSPPMKYTRSPPPLQETSTRYSVYPYNGGDHPAMMTPKDQYSVMPKLMPISPPHQPSTPPSLEPINSQLSPYHNSTVISGDRRHLSHEPIPPQTRCYSTSPPLLRHAESDVTMDCDEGRDDNNRPLDLSCPQQPTPRHEVRLMPQLPGHHFSDDEIAYIKMKAREDSDAYNMCKADLSHTQKIGLPRLFFKSK